MSVTSGFFNSKNGDRRYDAVQMSSIFDGIIRDGVFMHFGDALMVKPGGGMSVTVGIGKAWFNHTWTLNDSILPLSIDQAEVILGRIDAIVLEVNFRDDTRENSIKVVKGNPATVPAKPTIIKESDRKQYPLAYITVKPEARAIGQADIENKVGTSDCPFITAPLEKMDIDALITQWGAQWNVFYNAETSRITSARENVQNVVDVSIRGWGEQWRQYYEGKQTELEAKRREWEEQLVNFKNGLTAILDDQAEVTITKKLSEIEKKLDTSGTTTFSPDRIVRDMGDIKVVTIFELDGSIKEETRKKYDNSLVSTKTITFLSDGSVKETIS